MLKTRTARDDYPAMALRSEACRRLGEPTISEEYGQALDEIDRLRDTTQTISMPVPSTGDRYWDASVNVWYACNTQGVWERIA